MADDVLKPVVIEEIPFPELNLSTSGSNSSGNSTILTPLETIERKLPDTFVSRTVIADSLNTQSRKILSDYSFGEYGSISIGKYQAGVSGDIKISPNGIVTRNKNGETTIGLDGDTGDATFKGQLLAGNVITGGIDITGAGAINFNDGTNKAVLDASGLVSTNSFAETNSANGSLNQGLTGSNETDITGASLSVANTRRRLILILYSLSYSLFQTTGNTGSLTIRLQYRSSGGNWVELGRMINFNTPIADYSTRTYSNFYLFFMGSVVTYDFKLTAQIEGNTGTATANIYNFNFSYIIFGR